MERSLEGCILGPSFPVLWLPAPGWTLKNLSPDTFCCTVNWLLTESAGNLRQINSSSFKLCYVLFCFVPGIELTTFRLPGCATGLWPWPLYFFFFSAMGKLSITRANCYFFGKKIIVNDNFFIYWKYSLLKDHSVMIKGRRMPNSWC